MVSGFICFFCRVLSDKAEDLRGDEIRRVLIFKCDFRDEPDTLVFNVLKNYQKPAFFYSCLFRCVLFFLFTPMDVIRIRPACRCAAISYYRWYGDFEGLLFSKNIQNASGNYNNEKRDYIY